MAKKKDAAAPDAAQSGNGAATAVLDPPGEEAVAEAVNLHEIQFKRPTPEGWKEMAGQQIHYYFDGAGRVRGADVTMWRHASDLSGTTSYQARIRWENNLFHWYEPDSDAETGWKKVKRGQHMTQLQPIVDQAVEYAIGRVFGGWIT